MGIINRPIGWAYCYYNERLKSTVVLCWPLYRYMRVCACVCLCVGPRPYHPLILDGFL